MASKAAWLAPFMLALVGCALPKVMLGASVSLASARADGPAGGRSSVRSALWLALECSATGRDDDRDDRAQALPPGSTALHEPTPCALEATCAWERAATADASRALDEQGDPLP